MEPETFYERSVDVGIELLAQARTIGKSSLAVVGTSKNAGKSVVIGALVEALTQERTRFGLVSLGRDGEGVDVLEGTAKPRFWLPAGAIFATAKVLVPRSPGCEIVAVTGEMCALGPVVIARTRAPGYVEIAGPPSAAALRRVVDALRRTLSGDRSQSAFVLVDGAVDRVAAVRGGEDAIVVAVGAATATTMARASDEAVALTAKLNVPRYDTGRPFVDIDAALTASMAAALVREGGTHQVVVRDPTQIAFSGRTFLQLAARLELRCREPLHPIACSVAAIGPDRTFEPHEFAREVAERTRLPVYNVYASLRTEAHAA